MSDVKDKAPLPDPVSVLEVLRVAPGGREAAQDDVADEVPVALEYNGVSHAVMLATPLQLEAFALGFSLAEGILQDVSECYDIEIDPGENGVTVRLTISNRAFTALKARRRTLAGRTGCGLCGTESLAQVLRPLPQVSRGFTVRASAIKRAMDGLRALQPLNERTGCLHAAAWAASDGRILALFEDVGRHNALDKLIGARAREGGSFEDGFLLLTSRASVEMIQKAATVGIGTVVAISAPTSLAVRTAATCGLTLIAFARGARFVTYSCPENVEL